MTEDFDVEAYIEAPLKKISEAVAAEKGAHPSNPNHYHDNETHHDDYKYDARYPDDMKSHSNSVVNGERGRDDAKSAHGRSRSRERSRDRTRRSDPRDRDSRHRRRSRSRRRDDRDRDRHRDRDPRRSRSREYRRRSRSRDRERYRSRDRRSDRERDRHGHRRRSRSSDRRRRERSRERSPRISSKPSREPSPPVSQEDRDRRTVFCMQLHATLKDSELIHFFERAGRVRDVRIIADKASRRSKGVAYVEFREDEAVEQALTMTGEKLLGVPIIVQRTEAEKNRIAEQAARAAKGVEIPHHRLYVGSLQYHLTENDLRQAFEPFGRIDSVIINKDHETGRSNGFGFVQFFRAEDAKRALEQMNGVDLAGRNIRVGLVTEKGGSHNTDLDDGDVVGLSLTQQSRAELMAKLARNEKDLFPMTNAASSQTNVVATRCVLLKNMFNPAEETEPNWEEEIQADVKEECEAKYGKVVHVAVAVTDEREGHVYLKFDMITSSQRAVTGLNGRWFSGKQIEAGFVPELTYNAKYPEATLL